MSTSKSLPALDTLLDLVRDERGKQISHFDALDTKAGMVLGFAGLLIALAPDVPLPVLAPALIAALAAAGFALDALRLRPFGALLPSPLRRYLAAEDGYTRRRVFDTLVVIVHKNGHELERKARRLRRAAGAIAAAALLFALGMLTTGVQGDRDGTEPAPGPTGTPAGAP